MAFWVDGALGNRAGKANQGWFDFPNGWTADAFGTISFCAHSSGGGGGDSELFIHGFCVSGSHKGHDWGQIHSCIAPQGAVITVSTNRGIAHLRYRRLSNR